MEQIKNPEKSLILTIGDFRNNLVNLVNNSGLSPYFTLMIVRELATELEKVATAQYNEELATYKKALEKGEQANVHSN